MKQILSMLMVMPIMIFGQGYSQKPCDSATEQEYNEKCVSISCFSIYTPRINREGPTPTIFDGGVQFVNGNALVEILFRDSQTAGLLNRDNTESCLDIKFIRYSSQDFSTGTTFIGTIISTFDTENQYRKLMFMINDTLLIKDTSDPTAIIYQGYFGLVFLVVDEVQAIYYFNFIIQQDNDLFKPVYTSFNLILHKNDYTCNLEEKCIQKAESTLLFCSAPEKCQLLTTTKVLYKNLRFSLLQTITEPGFESFYLFPFSVIYIGVDLERNANILSTNRVQGSTEINLQIDFTYDQPLTIKVKSILSAVNDTQKTRMLSSVISGTLAQQQISTRFYEITGEAICNINGSSCITRADNTLTLQGAFGKWCSSANTLYFNQIFQLLQTISEPGFESYYLIPQTGRYTAVGLSRKVDILSTTMVQGSTLIRLKVDFIYSAPITIKVESILSADGLKISGAIAYQEIQVEFSGIIQKSICKCIGQVKSTLKLCSEPGQCTTISSTKVIQQNFNFSLLQKITEAGFEDYYLTPISVLYNGSNLLTKGNILSSTIIQGSTVIQLSIKFPYCQNITITVQSKLSNESGFICNDTIRSSINAQVSCETMIIFMLSVVILIIC